VKVAVTLSIEVDADGWEMDYGVSGASAIRADVKLYLKTAIEGLGNIQEVSVK